uniref:Variant surface glycoprotein n=1 Tax=Trypanosoma brucei TaxID=5691 RepID=A0A1V0FZD0_9TRYP|nr:variant surface glycoprotein [Trypanosoma brucei]
MATRSEAVRRLQFGRPTLFVALLQALCTREASAAANHAAIKKEAANLVCSLSADMAAVGGYAMHRLSELTATKANLEYLFSDMEAANFNKAGGGASLLAKLARKAREEIRKLATTIATKTQEGLLAAAQCSYDSGRLNEFLSVFYQKKLQQQVSTA